MALRVGLVGPVGDESEADGDYYWATGDGPRWLWAPRLQVAVFGLCSGLQLTTNLELVRTRGI